MVSNCWGVSSNASKADWDIAVCQCPCWAVWPRERRGNTNRGARDSAVSILCLTHSGPQKEKATVTPASLPASSLLSTPLSLPRNSRWPQLETLQGFHHLLCKPKGEGRKHIKRMYGNLYCNIFSITKALAYICYHIHFSRENIFQSAGNPSQESPVLQSRLHATIIFLLKNKYSLQKSFKLLESIKEMGVGGPHPHSTTKTQTRNIFLYSQFCFLFLRCTFNFTLSYEHLPSYKLRINSSLNGCRIFHGLNTCLEFWICFHLATVTTADFNPEVQIFVF